MSTWKIATVQFNYHIAVDKMYYSVPYEYIKYKVDVRLTSSMVEMKKTDLCTITEISSPTLAKLSKNQPVDGKVLERICAALQCQPGDVIEYVPDEGK